MSKQTIVIDTELSGVTFQDNCQLKSGSAEGLDGLGDFLRSVAGGVNIASVSVRADAVAADGYYTVATGGSTNNQACTLLNVTLTAKTSASLANEFTISATAATQAQNMVNAINASASFTGKVVASRNGARVVLTSVIPGALGNGFQASAGTLSNVTLTKSFSGGSDGTKYVL